MSAELPPGLVGGFDPGFPSQAIKPPATNADKNAKPAHRIMDRSRVKRTALSQQTLNQPNPRVDIHPLDPFIHPIKMPDLRQLSPSTSSPQKVSIATRFALLAVVFAIATPLDLPLSHLAHESGVAPWLKSHHGVALLIRQPGIFYFYVPAVCIALLFAAHRRGENLNDPAAWRRPAIVLLAAVLSGVNAIIKIVVGRTRPYHGLPPFEFHPLGHNLPVPLTSFSFPSGDASLAFAVATALTLIVPRYRFIWIALAVIVGLERIAENAHYPSDVVAGAALGIAVAIVARKLVDHFFKSDANPSRETIIAS